MANKKEYVGKQRLFDIFTWMKEKLDKKADIGQIPVNPTDTSNINIWIKMED